MSSSTRNHYIALFTDIERTLGEVHSQTITGVVGFTAGGPVSLCQVGNAFRYVTCELSLNPDQVESEEGLRFELIFLGDLTEIECHQLLTALGALSMSACLGDGHTIDVPNILSNAPFKTVRIKLQSQCEISGHQYGIYEVVPVQG